MSTFASHLRENLSANKVDSLAQQVEHIPFKDGVLGSSPRRITKESQTALLFFIRKINKPIHNQLHIIVNRSRNALLNKHRFPITMSQQSFMHFYVQFMYTHIRCVHKSTTIPPKTFLYILPKDILLLPLSKIIITWKNKSH